MTSCLRRILEERGFIIIAYIEPSCLSRDDRAGMAMQPIGGDLDGLGNFPIVGKATWQEFLAQCEIDGSDPYDYKVRRIPKDNRGMTITPDGNKVTTRR